MRTKTMTVLLLTLLMTSTLIIATASSSETVSLSDKWDGVASWSYLTAYKGKRSANLLAENTIGSEARVTISVSENFTLGDLDSISWKYFLEEGYAPHVDVMLDTTGDGFIDDALVFEYAYNDYPEHTEGTWPQYECLTGEWYSTFNDDGDGPSAITNSSYAWPTTGPPGPFTSVCETLADWKEGITYGSKEINSTTSVIELQFEVDNWLVTSEAFIDEITVNDKTYGLEQPRKARTRKGLVWYGGGYSMGTMWTVSNKLIVVYLDSTSTVSVSIQDAHNELVFERNFQLHSGYSYLAIYLPSNLFPEGYTVIALTDSVPLPYVVASSQYGIERNFNP